METTSIVGTATKKMQFNKPLKCADRSIWVKYLKKITLSDFLCFVSFVCLLLCCFVLGTRLLVPFLLIILSRMFHLNETFGKLRHSSMTNDEWRHWFLTGDVTWYPQLVCMHEMKMFEIERRVLLSPRKSHGGNTSRR